MACCVARDGDGLGGALGGDEGGGLDGLLGFEEGDGEAGVQVPVDVA